MVLQMENARQKKIPASFCRYFPRENCHITKKKYRMQFRRRLFKNIFFKKIYLTKLENN